jgi:transposase
VLPSGVVVKRKLSLGERREQTRMEAAALFGAGKRVYEVAAQIGVAYETAHRWKSRWERGGLAALRSRGKPGPDKQLNADQLEELERALVAGAQAAGFESGLWTLGRVRAWIARRFGVRYSEVAVWKLLRQLNWSPQKPARRAREADPQALERWKAQRWPQLVAQAEREGRVIVFVDESGFSQRPARKRTWAPRGQTPLLEFNFNWKRVSAIAGVSFYELWFALHEGTIRAPQVVEFIRQLRARIGQKLLLVWDGLKAHSSRVVRAFLDSLAGAVRVERLPAYAPELNPVEFLWGYLKNHPLANLTPDALWKLSKAARNALFKAQKRPSVIAAFWVQAELVLA